MTPDQETPIYTALVVETFAAQLAALDEEAAS